MLRSSPCSQALSFPAPHSNTRTALRFAYCTTGSGTVWIRRADKPVLVGNMRANGVVLGVPLRDSRARDSTLPCTSSPRGGPRQCLTSPCSDSDPVVCLAAAGDARFEGGQRRGSVLRRALRVRYLGTHLGRRAQGTGQA